MAVYAGQLVLLVGMSSFAYAETTYRCPQKNGRPIYQNWPCGTQPEVEKSQVKPPDYPEVVKCSMAKTVANVVRQGVGQKPVPANCTR